MSREEIRAKVAERAAFMNKVHPFASKALGPVFIRLMTAERAKAVAQFLMAEANQDRIVASCACCLCDESGAMVYDVSKPEDLAELAGLGMDTLSEIVAESNRLNGQSEQGVVEAGNV
jgi:hypothetical protein